MGKKYYENPTAMFEARAKKSEEFVIRHRATADLAKSKGNQEKYEEYIEKMKKAEEDRLKHLENAKKHEGKSWKQLKNKTDVENN